MPTARLLVRHGVNIVPDLPGYGRSHRRLVQLAPDGTRETPRMAAVAVPDHLRFGPVSALRLFHQLTRFPSLERLQPTPVRASPAHVTVVVIHGAAHAINFSHPGELANVVAAWLEGREIVADPDQPGVARVVEIPRG